MSKVLIIIPAYNEERSIENVIREVKSANSNYDILVINDGSSDNTSKIAKTCGVKVIDLPFNLGIGGAVQTGFIYAKNEYYDIAVQLDGDGQHDSRFIKDLIVLIENQEADMVIGSRFKGNTNYKIPILRKIGMIFFSKFIKILTGLDIKDTTSGFRAVNRRVIEYFSERYPLDYPEVDVIVRLYKKGFKIKEIPVYMNARKYGRSSITPLKAIYYMVKVSFALFINYLRSEKLV